MRCTRTSTYRAAVHASGTTLLPLLAAADVGVYGDPAAPVLDEFMAELAVAYSFGPPWGERFVNWLDLDRLGLSRRTLRRHAATNLGERLAEARVHGQPPALMLSFDGLESSLLLADPFWDGLAADVPGDLVVGVPARDVVIVTGSQSPSGLEKARRAVERVFFAGDQHLLSRELLVRRHGIWQVFDGGP
jgi:uncharacterized protein YtpQ (UPF0354 family)